jgi:molybdopterin converting factor small subunit
MSSDIEVHLFGSLKKTLVDSNNPLIQLRLKDPTPLRHVLESIEIASDSVQLVMVNHKAVPKDTLIYPGDRLALFPKEYAVFADWRDFRF